MFASDQKDAPKKEEAKKDEVKFEKISHEDLKKSIEEKKVFLVDCNGDESFAKGRIPTAVNCKSADFESKLPADKTALIVAYCGSEKCVAWKDGASKLSKLGYTNIKNYSGGLKGWTTSGGTLEK
jgi:rhodanese-related sulfurtransferase